MNKHDSNKLAYLYENMRQPAGVPTIVALDMNDRVVGRYKGQWSPETYNANNLAEEMGYEFEEWGDVYTSGAGWKLYANDGAGMVVVDNGVDVRTAVRQAIKSTRDFY